VASAGGGRSGYRLLASVIDACELLRDRLPLRLKVFTGPFMDNEAFEKLSARAAAGFRIRRYTKRFPDYLYAADLSVSLAGYNTCMNLLVSQVPALVYPYARQREQPLRVHKFKNMLPMKSLDEEDVQPIRLSDHIVQMLDRKRTVNTLPIDIDGASHSADFLSRWGV
jgi:predicted glycosyltransferase